LKTPSSNQHGFTLIECLIAIGCGSIMMAAILTASVALQRTFNAVENYSITEAAQLRVLDYIAMDCRRATSASIANNVITLNLPVYYSSSSPYSAVTPTLSSGVLSYGSGSVTITYQKNGTSFDRRVVIKNSSGTTTSDSTISIATNVASFVVNDIDLTTSLSCSIFFFPTFIRMPGAGTWNNGAAAPSNAVGADGDFYVIDTTATDPTTVGNVYAKKDGAYTLLSNIKATVVYCNTFLRNANCRQ